jgi:hypothetical protein
LSEVFDDVVLNVLNVQCCHLRMELCDDVRFDLVGESRESAD